MTVAVIGIRMDMYALFYAFWLCILTCLNRGALSKVWYLYMFFIAVLLPIQYFMTIGVPPFLCFGKRTNLFLILVKMCGIIRFK